MKKLVLFPCICIALLTHGQITTIHDIQYSTTGPSPLDGMTVTTEGVVTASNEWDNLGAIFIQQEGAVEWGGIQLKGSSDLYTLEVGDRVLITGVVDETSGGTTLNFITNVTVLDSNVVIDPVSVDPDLFSNYSFPENAEYEGMLLTLERAPNTVFIVDQNPDEPNNFGDYRIGSSISDPDMGCRVLAGRQTSSLFSSLFVSYINDEAWETNSGSMYVPGIVVSAGDEFVSVSGILVYGFGDLRLLPRNNGDFVPVDDSGIADRKGIDLQFTVGPNPTTGTATVRLAAQRANTMVLRISDILGKSVSATTYLIVPGENTFVAPTLGLPPGTYILDVRVDDAGAAGILIKESGE